MARENPNAVLANNLRSIRKARRLSQEQLAELVDLHRTYIGAIERGEGNITLNTLEQIASALEISCAQLLAPLRHKRH